VSCHVLRVETCHLVPKTLADQVDYGAELTIDNPTTYDAISKFFGSEQEAVEDARMSIVGNIHQDPVTSNINLVVVGDTLFRYRLLDLFADALDAPHPANFSAAPRIPHPPYMSRMENVRTIIFIMCQ
jgi:hypothetical protein